MIARNGLNSDSGHCRDMVNIKKLGATGGPALYKINNMTSETAKCPTIYGPNKSRRMGLSLGVNLGDAELKSCSWSCVYCQCGYGIRGEYAGRVMVDDIVEMLKKALVMHPNLDSVTFAGNSEPTAYPHFLGLVRKIIELRKKVSGRWVFNVLSNGSELDNDEVREACELLDEAWIKVDCSDDELQARLNRPLARIGSVEKHVERIAKLRTIRLQTLLWRDTQTDRDLGNLTEKNLNGLLDIYCKLRPVMIHLTTVARDTATQGLAPARVSELEVFAKRVRAEGLAIEVFP
jgi:wyosine [tRNA(Phe)-imidazoG37] synthetase (radical SAM superfamily)